jgi:hypothetical protein
MKKILLFFYTLVFSLNNFGAIQLAVEVERGGKKTAPTINVKSGELATISQDNLKMQVKAEERDDKAATISCKIFETKDGVERLLAAPSVAARWGESAEVISQSDQLESIRLKVTPTLIP